MKINGRSKNNRISNQTESFGAFQRKIDGSPVENETREAAREKREKEIY